MEVETHWIENEFGYCCYVFDHDNTKENKLYAEVFHLRVYPEFRKQGKSRKILQEAIDSIRKTGYSDEIRIEALPEENSISLEELTLFYKRMGFKIYK